MSHRFEKLDPPHYVTKEEAQYMIDKAITRHNRNASLISIWLGSIVFAAFLDGMLRMIGKIPPFAGIDINIIKPIFDQLS